LLTRSHSGLHCDICGYSLTNDEIVAALAGLATQGKNGFKSFRLKIDLTDPEDAEHFLRGLIVARSNNSSPYFEELIDGINLALQPWRAQRLAAQQAQL
jgi:hypothetical protein